MSHTLVGTWRRTLDLAPSPEEIFQEAGTPAWGDRLVRSLRRLIQHIDENALRMEQSPLLKLHHGATADRPTGGNLFLYQQYFDTDLGIPIWWDGANWIDATGATV